MPRSQKFAVVASTFNADAREAARLSREAGFTGLQLDVYTDAMRLPDLTASGRRGFRTLLSRQDQELASLRVELGPKGFGVGADVDRLLFNLDRAMETAAGLAAPLLCVDLGPLPEPPREASPKSNVTPQQAGLILLPETVAAPAKVIESKPPPDPAFVAQVEAVLADLGAKADRYNVILALRSELSSFAAIHDAFKRVKCPWFGIDLDPVAVLRDEWSMDEIFSRFGGLIRHVRARDATKGADRRTRPAPIGRGDTDWPQLLTSLDEAAYAGWITLDPTDLPDRHSAAAAGLNYLREPVS
jgi:sugar phosphate isomerase/epimerase